MLDAQASRRMNNGPARPNARGLMETVSTHLKGQETGEENNHHEL